MLFVTWHVTVMNVSKNITNVPFICIKNEWFLNSMNIPCGFECFSLELGGIKKEITRENL